MRSPANRSQRSQRLEGHHLGVRRAPHYSRSQSPGRQSSSNGPGPWASTPISGNTSQASQHVTFPSRSPPPEEDVDHAEDVDDDNAVGTIHNT